MLESRCPKESTLIRKKVEPFSIQRWIWQRLVETHSVQYRCWEMWLLCKCGCWWGPCGDNVEGGTSGLLFLALGPSRDAKS